MEKTISKSTKNRQGKIYSVDGVKKDGLPRKWKQVVIIENSALKRVNGKPLLNSKTKHIPA